MSKLFAAALLLAANLSAQVNATGTFSGQVTDAAGAAVPNAQVKITEQDTGVAVTRPTSGDGYYTVPLLKPGVYSIEVTAPGFSTGVPKSLPIHIQQVVHQDFKLQVGGVHPG